MHAPLRRVPLPLVVLGVAAALAACGTDAPTEPADANFGHTAFGAPRVSVCHGTRGRANVLEVARPALAAHLAHGDYITTLLVSQDPQPTNDGVHFRRITDALAAARAGRLARGESASAACRITIEVGPGTFTGSLTELADGTTELFPLVVDVPDITLDGALVMRLDARRRATGDGVGHRETILAPVDPLPFADRIAMPIIIGNSHPGGSSGDGLHVTGFVFQSGHAIDAPDPGGQGILSVRVRRFAYDGNRFEVGFHESIDVRGGSGEVLWNHLYGTAATCDICLAGPGRFRAVGNRLLAGGIPGIVVTGVVGLPVPAQIEPVELPATALVEAELRNNEIRDHTRVPVGVGIRIDVLGTGAPDVHNVIRADIRDNLLVGNRFGLIVHGAFPVAGTDLKSDAYATIEHNTILQSCQAKLLVSFSRHNTTLGLASLPFLLNSTFRLTLGRDLRWDDVWYGHPEGFGNTFIVNGHAIPNGTRQFYEADGCPGLEHAT
jgi:hypothetical protein